jgi:hypothetical protein
LVAPISGALLDVQPLHLQAGHRRLPELTRVIVATSEQASSAMTSVQNWRDQFAATELATAHR